MIDYALFAAAYCLFHISHGIGDYWLQTQWMAKNKSKSFINLPLTTHAVIYSLSFIPALLVLGVKAASWNLPLLLCAIGVPHLLMDNRMFLTWFIKTTKGWLSPRNKTIPVRFDRHADSIIADWHESLGIEQAVKVHVTIHMDQKYHYLCLGLVALWIAMK